MPGEVQESYADAAFPLRGVDLSAGYGAQRPLTTVEGTNVRTFEPSTDRARGGSRPGLAKFIAGQVPEGSELIQHLNTVVMFRSDALLTGTDPPEFDPVTGFPSIPDPSSPGDPTHWATTPILFDEFGDPVLDPGSGDPVSSATEESRNGGGPGSTGGVAPHMVRKGGSGVAPSMAALHQLPPPSPTPKRCFTGTVTFRINNPPPDIYHWNGLLYSVAGTECRYYNPPTIPAPTSAIGFGSCVDQIVAYLRDHVGPDATYTVLSETVTGPGGTCTNVGHECTM